MSITRIDTTLLDAAGHAAAASPRRRRNHNFHDSDTAMSHRLLNALQADSYVPPHRHLDPNKAEAMLALRGRFGVVVFDDSGCVVETVCIEAGGACCGVDIPPGTWHTVLALEDGAVLYETKAGPFQPLEDAERATWAPAENGADAPAYLQSLQARFRDH